MNGFLIFALPCRLLSRRLHRRTFLAGERVSLAFARPARYVPDAGPIRGDNRPAGQTASAKYAGRSLLNA